MKNHKILVISEGGFSWFVVASTLDRRSMHLEWHREPGGIREAVTSLSPHLVVVGEVGTSSEDLLFACREAVEGGGRTVLLDLPEKRVDPQAAAEAGCVEVIHLDQGTDTLRARLLENLGLAAAREPRLRLARPVVLEWEGRAFPGTTIDLGPGGAALRVSGDLPSGAMASLVVELSAGHPLHCDVEVLRSSGGVVAVRFADLSSLDQDRLLAMARRGSRDLPALFDGVPRIVDVLLQFRHPLQGDPPSGPLPEEWVMTAIPRLGNEEKSLLLAFDPTTWTTHREEDDDRALLFGSRMALAWSTLQLAEWDGLSHSVQERLADGIRANLQAAERVFKEVAVRGMLRREGESKEEPDLKTGQRVLLQEALPLRDRWNALAGDEPISVFPALQIPEDYFRAGRNSPLQYDPAAFRSRERVPRRAEFSAVVVEPPPKPSAKGMFSRPGVVGVLLAVALLVGILIGFGRGGDTGGKEVSAATLGAFGGVVQSAIIRGEESPMFLGVVDRTRWNALDEAGRAAVKEKLRGQMGSLKVGQAALFDPRGELLAVVLP